MRQHPRHGVYILAAAVIAVDAIDLARGEISSLAPSQGQRFHWRLEGAAGRRKAVAVVAALPMLHYVVVGAPLDDRRQERARRRCLERLLFELDQADVQRVFLEARTASLNRKDSDAVAAFRAQRVIGSQLRVDHAYPLDEPMLWAPDIVAGSCRAAQAGDPSYYQDLALLVSRYDIQLQ